jgi:hypothetical protein
VSGEPAVRTDDGSGAGPDEGSAGVSDLDRLLASVTGADSDRIVEGTGVGAAIFVALAAVVRTLRNAPLDPVAVPGPVETLAWTGTPIAVGLALVAVGVASEQAAVRVGALFAGVFAPMAAIDPAASLAAAAAVAAGGGLALLGAVGLPATDISVDRTAIATALVAGVAVSLAAATASIDGGYRPTGAAITLLAIGAVVTLVRDDRPALIAGVLAGGGFLVVADASPFAVGGTLLSVFAVAGVPTLLVAFAVAGASAVAVTGTRRGDPTLVAGACLLVLAGLPTTAPRAAAVLLGAMLVLAGPDRLLGQRTADRPDGGADPEEVTTA